MLSKRKATDNEIDLPAKFSRIDEVMSRGNNSLMQLNEIGIKGLKWTIEQVCNAFPQKFRGTCVFGEPFSGAYEIIPSGTIFYHEGLSKSVCKHEIANQIMDRLSGKNLPQSNFINVPLPPSNPIINETLNSNSTSNNGDIPQDSAVRILNEKMRDIEYKFVLQEDGYCCYVSFRGFVIKGVGTNKKTAKRVVASKILQKYYKIKVADENKLFVPQSNTVTNPPVDETDNSISKTPKNRQKNFSNLIQSMVKNGFEKLVSTLEVQYSKRKVLSGIIISRKLKIVFPDYYREDEEIGNNPMVIDPMLFYSHTGWNINPDDQGEILKLITISSGTKCLSGNEINDNGLVINDSHAEVISKRAFQLFICQTISRQQNNVQCDSFDQLFGCDILEPLDKSNQTVYSLKEDVKIHLYVSSAPCGDSRIFLPQSLNVSLTEEMEEEPSPDDPSEDTHPNRKNRGLLRTKIECGEGTIPIKMKSLQTWDGILGGERLLTMSCSDKVCTWNVLGIQGALLSNMLAHPVYLNSITIGSLFHQEHLERALSERAQGVIEELDWRNGNALPNQYEDIEQGELKISSENIDLFNVNKPYILTVTDQDERCPGKASNFSVNWILGEENFEIISTAKGVKLDNTPSRLCKWNLLNSFLSIFKWLDFIRSNDGYYRYNEMKSLELFPDNAIGAVNYQKKRISLFKFFEKQSFGLWIGKPIEQDWFSIKFPA